MQCPHCSISFHEAFSGKNIEHYKKKGSFTVFYDLCPACKEYIIYLKFSEPSKNISKTIVTEYIATNSIDFGFMVYPKLKRYKPLSNDIPQEYIRQYEEAYAILTESPNASAALSRSCLQQLLEHKGNIKKDDLAKE